MDIKYLKAGSHIHMMGICGTAMASLAGLLKERGYEVTGSDSNPYPPMSTQIENLGIKIMKPYSAQNLHPNPDFVIVGNVISSTNEEAQELKRLDIPYTSLPQAMGEIIIDDKQSIVISGTHGKTTTTSLMAWIMTELGFNPGFLIGGIAKNFSKSFQNPKGDSFVIEGDEYDTAFFDKVPKFIHYKPKHVILTSIEFDHADIYKDLNAVKEAFSKLVSIIPENGTFVYNAEDINILELSHKCLSKNKASYGLNQGDFTAEILTVNENSTKFRVWHHLKDDFGSTKKKIGEFEMILSGNYNVMNALSVIVLSVLNDFDITKVAHAIKSFQGVKRRQEILGEPNGVLVIEDFAHHPTAVRETLSGIIEKYKGREVFAVFEPRSATSRRRVFQKEYSEAFKGAKKILIMKAFDQSKIEQSDRFSSEELVSDIRKNGQDAVVFDHVNDIIKDLKKSTKKGDLILIMSNGGFDGIYQKLLNVL